MLKSQDNQIEIESHLMTDSEVTVSPLVVMGLPLIRRVLELYCRRDMALRHTVLTRPYTEQVL